MKNRKIVLGIFTVIILLFFYCRIQFENVSKIRETCLSNVYDQQAPSPNAFELDKIYDFSQLFDCKDWDEVIIVGGKRANKIVVLFKDQVFLPNINYAQRASGSLMFYFLKGGKLIGSPVEVWQPGFDYSVDFNSFDYVNLNKEEAIFKCIKLNTVGPMEMLTLEKID